MEQLLITEDDISPGEGSSSAGAAQLNAEVVWLENWFATAILNPENRLEMTFLHTEVLDIRVRARTLQQLLNWEDEGAVVERWIENYSMFKEHSQLALGRYLKRIWHRELEWQRALKQSNSAFANKWQPPGPELIEESRVRCNERPFGFALDPLSQWHKELRYVLRFLQEMEAGVAYSPLERWGSEGALNTSQVINPPTISRGNCGRADRLRRPREAYRRARHRPSYRVLSTDNPRARLLLDAGRTASSKRQPLRPPPPEQHVQKQSFRAAKGVEEGDTLRSSADTVGIPTGIPFMPRLNGRTRSFLGKLSVWQTEN